MFRSILLTLTFFLLTVFTFYGQSPQEPVIQNGVSRHHLTASYLNYLGKEVVGTGLSGGLSYFGKFSTNQHGRVRPLLGVGVFQFKYRGDYIRRITAVFIRPQALLNVYPALQPYTTV